jgi:hypothetical protein
VATVGEVHSPGERAAVRVKVESPADLAVVVGDQPDRTYQIPVQDRFVPFRSQVNAVMLPDFLVPSF